MNIEREIIGLLNELITIELLESDYQDQVTKSLKDLKRKAHVPGFRQGNVPMGMIEKMYKKAVIADEIAKLTNDEITKYLVDNQLDILFEAIARNEKTEGDFDNAKNFRFSFEIGLRPEITINYADAKKVVDYKVIPSEAEIEKEILAMRRRVGQFSSTEEVADQDMLLVKFKPEEQGEEVVSSLLLEYVKDSELAAFIGKKKHDELEIDTTKVFKSDYERSTFLKVKTNELENAPKKIRIKIDAIHHIEPAEIDDEFFSKTFPDGSVRDEAALRNEIKEQIVLRHVNETNVVYRSKVLDVLMEKTAVELPDDFIKRYLVENKQEYTTETIEEKYNDIRKSVVYQLIENQICTDFTIRVEYNDTIRYIEDYVRQAYFGTTEKLNDEMEKQIASLVQQMTDKKENMQSAYENVLFDKITTSLRAKIEPKTKELIYDDFIAEISGKKPEKSTKSKPKVKKETVE